MVPSIVDIIQMLYMYRYIILYSYYLNTWLNLSILPVLNSTSISEHERLTDSVGFLQVFPSSVTISIDTLASLSKL